MSEPKITWKRPRTFKTESGEVLPICPVSQIDAMPFERILNEGAPKPPIEIIDGVAVANEAHEDYRTAKTEFDKKKAIYMMAVFIQLGVEMDLTDEQQAKVTRAKKNIALVNPESAKAPEYNFDVFNYVKTLCPEMDELQRLVEAIVTINTPSSAQVANHLETFRPYALGQTDNGNPDTAERGQLAVG